MNAYAAGAMSVISALLLGAAVGISSIEVLLRWGAFYGTLALLAEFVFSVCVQCAVTQYLWRKC